MMRRAEFTETLEYELFRGKKLNPIEKLRIKYIQPNTNCIYLSRKMWYLYERAKQDVHAGGEKKVIQRLKYYRCKLIYLKIMRKYGCCIYASAKVGRGFWIEHPVGIVLGNCIIGENFTIHQNTTIGVKHRYDDSKGVIPVIGNNVHLCANACILGGITICDDVTIGAGAIISVSCKPEKVRNIKQNRAFYGIIDASESREIRQKPCIGGRTANVQAPFIADVTV